MKILPVVCTVFIVSQVTIGLEYNKQRYNSNNDFLLHESGGNPTGPKKDPPPLQPMNSPPPNKDNNNRNTVQQGYDSQFPQLKQPTPTQPANPTNNNKNIRPQSNNGKRDYVAPQSPTIKPSQGDQQSPGNRDYVAPQSPTIKPQGNQQSTGKRDYVAPQSPTIKPQGNQQSTGKVKDLINFYDKNSDHGPQGVPSYSSILQGSANKNVPVAPTLQTTTKPSTSTAKPISFSAAVAGSNKPGQPSLSSVMPTTKVIPSSSTPKPNNPVLPSQIANRNKNNQGNSNSLNSASDAELQVLSEELLRKDTNNAAKYVTVNYQEKTTSQSKEDKAPGPLLTVSSEAWNIPTIQKFTQLLDNYERDTMVNEYVTPQERNEENAFMDAIMATTVIRHLMNFLKDKGYVTPDPRQQRDFLKQLWFTLYSRGKGKIGSSGFEHVFVSELKNGEVSGLHNWIYFTKEETANRINYLGYLKYAQLNDRGVVMKLHFNQQGVDKPVDSMFIGTSPELEIALYTLCFVTRADNECKLKLANNDIEIVSHTFRYRSKNLIGSAYPQLPVVWR